MSRGYFLVTGIPLGAKCTSEKSNYKQKWQRHTIPISTNYTFVTNHLINKKINIKITNDCNNSQMRNNRQYAYLPY